MDDLISRKKLLRHLSDWQMGEAGRSEAVYTTLDNVMEAVNDMPPAERKRGRWIWLSSTYDRTPCEMRYWCSECYHETIVHSNEMSYPWENYCPNCGAEMRGEEG